MKMNHTKRLLQILGFLSLAAIGALALTAFGPPDQAKRVRGPAQADGLAAGNERQTTTLSGQSRAINARFMAGEVFRYRYESLADLTIDVVDEGQTPSGVPQQTQTARLDATLEVKVVASDETGYSLWIAFEDALLTQEAEGPAASAVSAGSESDAEVSRERERTALVASGLVDFDARGRATGIEVVQAKSPSESEALRQVVGLLQWVESEDAGARRWQTIEMDSLGRFEARYAPAPKFAPGGVRKALQYTSLNEAAFPSDARLVWAQGEFLVDSVAPLTKGRGERRATLQLPSERMQLSIVESCTLELESRRFSDEVASIGRDGVLALREEGIASGKASVRPVASAIEFGADLGALMHHIEDLLFSGERDDENTLAAIDLLAEFLTEHPEQSASVLDWMQEHEDFAADDIREVVIVNGLAKSGTPEAQATLLEVASTGAWGPANQSMAVLSVLDIENPLPDWDTHLTTLFEGDEAIGQIALQALGAATSQFAEAGPEGAARRQQVMAQLRQHAMNADPERRASALVALSNAVPETTLPEIQSGLVDADEYVRSAAVLALSRVDNPSVETELLTFLREDPSEVVRRDVISLVQERLGADALNPLIDRLQNDPSVEVRRTVLGNLENYPDPEGRVRRAIAQVAANDPDGSMRQSAESVLNPEFGSEADSGEAASSHDASEFEDDPAVRAIPEFADSAEPFSDFPQENSVDFSISDFHEPMGG